jgi:hypothetical protein
MKNGITAMNTKLVSLLIYRLSRHTAAVAALFLPSGISRRCQSGSGVVTLTSCNSRGSSQIDSPETVLW